MNRWNYVSIHKELPIKRVWTSLKLYVIWNRIISFHVVFHKLFTWKTITCVWNYHAKQLWNLSKNLWTLHANKHLFTQHIVYISHGFTLVTRLLLVVELFMNKKLKILVKRIFCLYLREIALLERPQYYCFHFSIHWLSIHGRFDCMENLSPIPHLTVNIIVFFKFDICRLQTSFHCNSYM